MALFLLICVILGDPVDAFVLPAPTITTLSTLRTLTLQPVTHYSSQTQLHIWAPPRSFTTAAAGLWHTDKEPSLLATAMVAGGTCFILQLILQTVAYYYLQRKSSALTKDGGIHDDGINDDEVIINGDTTTTNINNNATTNKKTRRRVLLLATAVRQAHSKVALLLMTTVSIWGCWGWFGSAAPTTAAARIWGENTSVSKLAAVIGGGMVLWDIPIAIWSLLFLHVPSRSSLFIMLIHHVVMAAVAYVGATALPTHYGFFYLGVSELSSIPLVLYNELVERHKEQQQQQQQENSNNNNNNVVVKKTKKIPALLMTGLQIVTAVSFVLVRVVYFTKVTVGHFCPDVLKLLRGGDFSSARVLWFMLATSLGFTILQLYWFYANILSVVLPSSSALLRPPWRRKRGADKVSSIKMMESNNTSASAFPTPEQ